jgi:hypothetical protein
LLSIASIAPNMVTGIFFKGVFFSSDFSTKLLHV